MPTNRIPSFPRILNNVRRYSRDIQNVSNEIAHLRELLERKKSTVIFIDIAVDVRIDILMAPVTSSRNSPTTTRIRVWFRRDDHERQNKTPIFPLPRKIIECSIPVSGELTWSLVWACRGSRARFGGRWLNLQVSLWLEAVIPRTFFDCPSISAAVIPQGSPAQPQLFSWDLSSHKALASLGRRAGMLSTSHRSPLDGPLPCKKYRWTSHGWYPT
ncbi:hypothetical protein QBC37DRAFT_167951 [Rhypophila decipiens]|uniref:Uncharacterized protein n=1 Tax=Rhypophila decipiens TaxID=261697 RepID=A0AAN6YLX9_9PEZI|nr:hypothetical protein QBC37DRAFT_167951 [Rhypophila decipiens]